MAFADQVNYKKIILSAVIGIMGGGLSGLAYFRITSTVEPPEAFANLAAFVQARPLQGHCAGKTEPEVFLYWSLPDSVNTNRLFRSAGEVPAELIFDASSNDPSFVPYADHNVQFGQTYTYYFETDENVRSNEFSLLVSSESCQP